MQADQGHAVKVLNSLIETTLDSANGYREAAENAPDGIVGALKRLISASPAKLGRWRRHTATEGSSATNP